MKVVTETYPDYESTDYDTYGVLPGEMTGGVTLDFDTEAGNERLEASLLVTLTYEEAVSLRNSLIESLAKIDEKNPKLFDEKDLTV